MTEAPFEPEFVPLRREHDRYVLFQDEYWLKIASQANSVDSQVWLRREDALVLAVAILRKYLP